MLVSVDELSQGSVDCWVADCLVVVFVLKPSLGEISLVYLIDCHLDGEKLLQFFLLADLKQVTELSVCYDSKQGSEKQRRKTAFS